MARRSKYEIQFENIATTFKDAKQTAEEIEAEVKKQIPTQRNALFVLISRLTIVSFIFLIFVVSFQMFWKIRHPEYTVISDTVINVLAVGVFAELVGVVGIVAKLLWK